MDDDIVSNILSLYKDKNWKAIVDKYHDHPERNRVLWVYPSEDNFAFLSKCMRELSCDRCLSIGCGSGLLEWMLTEATGILATGIEVDGVWWRCKYAPPTFIPLLLTPQELEKDVIALLHNSDTTALLFCYFNNRPAFEDYLKHFSGSVLIIIGPDGKGVHTDPKPFNDVTKDWSLYDSQEVRDSGDFIAVYRKNIPFK